MFKLENDDAYVGLQAPISIDESIQRTIIMGSFTVTIVLNGGEDDGINSEEFATTYNSDH
jgi:hypothetical protein